MKYGNRSLWQKIISSPISIVVGVILLAILAKATFNISVKASQSSDRLIQAQVELSKLNERNNELSSRVQALSTEQGIEAEIRTKYHAVKDGESVAIIIGDARTASVNDASTTVKSGMSGWWSRLLHFFGL